MMVVGVEDQAIADLDEAATEGMEKMIFGEDVIRWADGDGVTIDQEHLVADAGVVEIVGGDDTELPRVTSSWMTSRMRPREVTSSPVTGSSSNNRSLC